MLPACFSPRYFAPTPTASMVKLPLVAAAARDAGFASLVDPGTIDPALLRRLHDPAYVDAFLAGEPPLASAQGWPWSPQIRDGVLAIHAGQLLGARLALTHGLAANIAQGFHHARWARGGGYCTFNGLALVAQEHPGRRVAVLDCDEHVGDGTAEFTRRLPNLLNFSICGSAWGVVPDGDRSFVRALGCVGPDFARYRAALDDAFTTLAAWRPDLVLYQAGADPHEDDPLGSLRLNTAQLFERDLAVFRWCLTARLPLLFVLAGGYQTPIETRLLPLHLNTFRAAAQALREYPPAKAPYVPPTELAPTGNPSQLPPQ